MVALFKKKKKKVSHTGIVTIQYETDEYFSVALKDI